MVFLILIEGYTDFGIRFRSLNLAGYPHRETGSIFSISCVAFPYVVHINSNDWTQSSLFLAFLCFKCNLRFTSINRIAFPCMRISSQERKFSQSPQKNPKSCMLYTCRRRNEKQLWQLLVRFRGNVPTWMCMWVWGVGVGVGVVDSNDSSQQNKTNTNTIENVNEMKPWQLRFDF